MGWRLRLLRFWSYRRVVRGSASWRRLGYRAARRPCRAAAFALWPLPFSRSTRWRPCSERSSMSVPTASETRRLSSSRSSTSSVSRGRSAQAAAVSRERGALTGLRSQEPADDEPRRRLQVDRAREHKDRQRTTLIWTSGVSVGWVVESLHPRRSERSLIHRARSDGNEIVAAGRQHGCGTDPHQRHGILTARLQVTAVQLAGVQESPASPAAQGLGVNAERGWGVSRRGHLPERIGRLRRSRGRACTVVG